MESFHWNSCFVTGLSAVDKQHHHLVDLINRFGSVLAEDDLQLEDVECLFAELADYAVYHFREEETLMAEAKMDARHVDKHIRVHKRFLSDVTSIYGGISRQNLEEAAESLLEFLMHWLAYHILGKDQDMGRQLKAIYSGVSPAEAYDTLEQERERSTAPLLNALDGLFEQVSRRNRELRRLNEELEDIVESRTKELSRANLKLETLALTDTLTGLPNRRYALQCLSTLWDDALANDRPLVCMMVDADHFKEVNDDYGHDAGDRVLRELAATLKDALRNGDTVCRLGGDEFLVICPNTNKESGMSLAESIRISVSKLRSPTGGKPWLGSVSIGVASRSPKMKNFEALIKMADLGVYAAKVDAKNCVRAGQ